MAKRRILVVDDEKFITAMLRDLLEAHGYEVLVAFDGQEGLNKARAERPDLILLDIMMPELDGLQVARLLKFNPAYQHIPIIVLTAKSGLAEAVREHRVEAHLVKPVEPKLLLEKVRSLLEASGMK